MIQELRNNYGSIFESGLLDEINQVATFKDFDAHQEIIKPGEYIKSIPLLLAGSIKIMRPDQEGEELLLYHLEKGEACAITMTCCMGNKKSEIRAITETPTRLLMIPIEKMEEWSSKYRTWRSFVYDSFHNRMMEILESIDNIAFHNMDERLEKYLETKVQILDNRHIYVTHKEIAGDLHTSRVVISRLLKKMEIDGKIEMHRSFIRVL